MLPPINNMMTQGALSTGMFAFYLDRDASDEIGGELSIGGVDPERYEGTKTFSRIKGRIPSGLLVTDLQAILYNAF